jgi:hypothetical protein
MASCNALIVHDRNDDDDNNNIITSFENPMVLHVCKPIELNLSQLKQHNSAPPI